ncbi:S9 family peptidase [Verrucomicrobium sp. BvORR106]|uniref:S9 family peptidase n=1 Tax=Verrucomicrobium sp. BvORR106 TaxID=1403819 RepID=UPI00056F7773|nr:S9 family peptidase [Verrucomicrobium sp. BvORR106]
MLRSILASLVLVTPLVGQEPTPKAERRSFSHREHGEARQDDYSWLKQRDDPAVRKYLVAENSYTGAYFKPLKPLYTTLLKELRSRVVDEDVSVPVQRGAYLYYEKYVAGSEYETLCRKKVADGVEEIMLDFNQRAKGHQVFLGGGASVSPDDRLLAWKENHDGTDVYTLHFLELATGKLLPDEVQGTAFHMGPVWGNDNRTLFYTTPDDTQRSYRVMRHVLGTAAKADVVVYEEADRQFDVRISPTKDRKYLMIESGSTNTTETRVVPLDRPGEPAVVLIPRKAGIRHNVAHREGRWYSVSNLGGTNGCLLTAVDADGKLGDWEELWPYEEKLALQWVDAFASHIVVGARNQGVPGVFLLDPETKDKVKDHRWVPAPVEGGSLDSDDTPDYHATAQRVMYTSYVTPFTVADLNLADGTMKVLKQKKVPSGFDPAKYVVEKVEAKAADGVVVPVWLVRRKDLPLDGSAGLVLDGYGSYGSCSDPWFDAGALSLLDRGVTVATAQVRGGGEFGRTWYEAGRVLKKEVTFTDYIACAKRLVELKYTSPSSLCAYGASAGGLIMGYVMNQAPELFRAVVADVPFVDALNTQFDPSIPLVTGEYEEWGNPEDRAVFDVMRRYVPYENVKPQVFPSLYVTTGWNDPRVAYWEPAKWVAKIRAVHQGKNPVLLETNFDAGHGGATGRYAQLEDVARRYAFILRELGKEN